MELKEEEEENFGAKASGGEYFPEPSSISGANKLLDFGSIYDYLVKAASGITSLISMKKEGQSVAVPQLAAALPAPIFEEKITALINCWGHGVNKTFSSESSRFNNHQILLDTYDKCNNYSLLLAPRGALGFSVGGISDIQTRIGKYKVMDEIIKAVVKIINIEMYESEISRFIVYKILLLTFSKALKSPDFRTFYTQTFAGLLKKNLEREKIERLEPIIDFENMSMSNYAEVLGQLNLSSGLFQVYTFEQRTLPEALQWAEEAGPEFKQNIRDQGIEERIRQDENKLSCFSVCATISYNNNNTVKGVTEYDVNFDLRDLEGCAIKAVDTWFGRPGALALAVARNKEREEREAGELLGFVFKILKGYNKEYSRLKEFEVILFEDTSIIYQCNPIVFKILFAIFFSYMNDGQNPEKSKSLFGQPIFAVSAGTEVTREVILRILDIATQKANFIIVDGTCQGVELFSKEERKIKLNASLQEKSRISEQLTGIVQGLINIEPTFTQEEVTRIGKRDIETVLETKQMETLDKILQGMNTFVEGIKAKLVEYKGRKRSMSSSSSSSSMSMSMAAEGGEDFDDDEEEEMEFIVEMFEPKTILEYALDITQTLNIESGLSPTQPYSYLEEIEAIDESQRDLDALDQKEDEINTQIVNLEEVDERGVVVVKTQASESGLLDTKTEIQDDVEKTQEYIDAMVCNLQAPILQRKLLEITGQQGEKSAKMDVSYAKASSLPSSFLQRPIKRSSTLSMAAHERQPSELDRLPRVLGDRDDFLHKYVWGKEEEKQREALKFVENELSKIPLDVKKKITVLQGLGKKRKNDINVPTENSSEWSDPEMEKHRKNAYKWLEIKKIIEDILDGKDESKKAKIGGKPKNKKTKNNKKYKRQQTKKKSKRRYTIKRSTSKKCRQTKKK
jgi:hypothetical protein